MRSPRRSKARGAELRRPLAHRAFEASFLLAAAALFAMLASRILRGAVQIEAGGLLALALGVGILSADLASGVLHWFCDRFFAEDTPLLGPLLIHPFREHHRDPLSMLRHGRLELHGNSCIPVVGALAVGMIATAFAPPSPARVAFETWLLCFCAAAVATNQFHAWAHAAHVPGLVRRLQQMGVILSPDRHARHHRGGFDRSYCMTSGLLNPILDSADLFGHLERLIRRLEAAVRG